MANNIVENVDIYQKYLHFLEDEIKAYGLTLELVKDKIAYIFEVASDDKVLVKISHLKEDVENPKVENLDIKLELADGISKDRPLLAIAVSAAISHLKIYKDIFDSFHNKDKIKEVDLDYYELYFKTLRKKWQGDLTS